MKNLLIIITLFSVTFMSLFLQSCADNTSKTEDKAKIIKDYQDSIDKAEKAKQDSIDAIIPEIKASIYARTNVFYDSEGWPVEMGTLTLIKDFQEKKEYKLKGYDYIEKIEISGESDDITLQFSSAKNDKIIFEEKGITLKGTKTFTSANPRGEKQKNHQDWLISTPDGLKIKVLYKEKVIFEGKITYSEK
jgi:hypothetical protein